MDSAIWKRVQRNNSVWQISVVPKFLEPNEHIIVRKPIKGPHTKNKRDILNL